jgi:class 3 adenylate cyclase
MDRHDAPDASAQDLALAHAADVGVQHKHGVRYLTYWFDDDAGSVFCLAEGPNREAVEEVHREAHGLMATSVIEVEPGPVAAFLGALPTHPVGEPYVESAVRAVLFTDIVDSTALTQLLGDEASMVMVHEHDRIVRDSLGRFGGREVKHTGDGIMASFSSASAAVEAAIEVQRAYTQRNESAERPIDLRIGISAGEPVVEGDDLFGATVQLAARLCSHCPPGRITVSIAVRELCVGKRLEFGDGGALSLKGFPEPMQCYDVGW